MTRRPSRCSAAATPGAHQRRLPLPDGPTTARTPCRRRAGAGRPSTSASRPKNTSASSTSYGSRPRYGHTSGWPRAALPRRPATGPGAGSPARARPARARGPAPSSVGQHRPGRRRVRKRLALPAGLILRQRQQRPAAFAQRRLDDPCLRLGEHLAVPPDLEGGLDAAAPRRRGAARRGARPRCVPAPSPPGPWSGRPRQRSSASPSTNSRPLRLTERQQLPARADQPLEPTVHRVVGVDGQPVAVRRRLDHLCAERLAQPHDAALHDLGPRRRWRLTPERFGQHLEAQLLARPHGKGFQHDPVSRRQAMRKGFERSAHDERSEDADVHEPHGPPA